MIKTISPLIRFVVLAGLSCWGAASHAADCKMARTAKLHLTVEDGHILVPGKIKGQDVKFLIDTAFPSNVMPSGSTARLGLTITPFNEATFLRDEGAGQSGNAHAAKEAALTGLTAPGYDGWTDINDISLDGIEMKRALFFSFHSAGTFGGPDVVGTLGSDLWLDFDIEIDLPNNLITLFHVTNCDGVDLAYWGGAYNVVDLSPAGALTIFPVKVNGQDLSAVIDTGSPRSSITDRAANKIDLRRGDGAANMDDPSPPGIQATDLPSLISFSHGIGLISTSPNVLSSSMPEIVAKPRSYWMAHLDSFAIDQEVISPMSLRVVSVPRVMAPEAGTRTPRNLLFYDMLLGVDFLKSHRILISHSQKKLYLAYTGDASFAKP